MAANTGLVYIFKKYRQIQLFFFSSIPFKNQ